MRETRREFVTVLATAISCLAASRLAMSAQRAIHPPPPPAPAETQVPTTANMPGSDAARRAALRRSEQEFRDGIKHLYELTNELQEEVQKTSSAEVFSIRTYKKTEAIEKLAKQLKNKAKGS